MASAAFETMATAPSREWPRAAVVIPGGFLVFMVAAAVVGPALLPDPELTSLADADLGIASAGHLLGTDSLGRDVLSRLVSATRVSLTVGFGAVVLAMLVGGTLGTVAGYRGGWADSVIMRIIDVLLAFPALVMAIAVATYLGPSIPTVVVALAVAGIPSYARLSRSVVLPLREENFVLAARLGGLKDRTVVLRHLMPAVNVSLLTYGLLAVGIAIIGEAALSFLGLGIRPPAPSWGTMIAEGRADLERAPHLVLIPGTTLFLTVLSLNLLADTLRSGHRRPMGRRDGPARPSVSDDAARIST